MTRPHSSFLHDLLQDVTVQREVRDQVLKLRVLLAQLPELAQLAQAQPRILLLPNVEGRFADPVFAPMSATLAPPSACRIARKICSSVCPFFATCLHNNSRRADAISALWEDGFRLAVDDPARDAACLQVAKLFPSSLAFAFQILQSSLST